MTGCEDREVPAEISLLSGKGDLVLVGIAVAFRAGVIISHSGSAGVEGADDLGESNIKVELSQPAPIRGEYAGVDGSESMKVPNDFADIGGDIGDIGVIGGEVATPENGDPIVENL